MGLTRRPAVRSSFLRWMIRRCRFRYPLFISIFLQVALPPDRRDARSLPATTGAAPGTAQCVTVDAATGITTGISAADRARTIRLLASSGCVTRVIQPSRTRGAPARGRGPAHIGLRASRSCSTSGSGSRFPTRRGLTTVVGTTDPTDVASGTHWQRSSRLELTNFLSSGSLTSTPRKHHCPASTCWWTSPAEEHLSLQLFTDLGHNHLVLAVGEVSGREDVPVHLLPADQVLIDAGSPSAEPLILIGLPQTAEDEYSRAIDGLHRQHSMIRAILRRLGCLSVVCP